MNKSVIRHHLVALLVIFSNCNGSIFSRRKLTIENTAKTPYYGAIYYKTKKRAVRATQPIPLTPNKFTTLALPVGKMMRKRVLLIGRQPEDLPQKFETDNEKIAFFSAPVDVGSSESSSLFLAETDSGVEVLPSQINEAEKIRSHLRTKIAQRSPHYDKVATVAHYPNRPSPQEHDYIAQRSKVTRKALSKFIGRHIAGSHVPTVSVAASGGGIRATLTTLGVLRGLQRIGLLNGISYMAGVSGGTWAITSWLLQNKSIDETIASHEGRYENIPPKNTLIKRSINEYNSVRYQKSLFGHGSGLTDLYSICLSKVMLKPDEPHYYGLFFSDLAKNLHPAQHPFPICTAVSRKTEMKDIEYHWLEFSPFDIRLATYDYCVPMWSFMRRFDNGSSIDKTPEPWLGFPMGLWGSAFSLSLDDVLVRMSSELNRWIPEKVLDWLMKSPFGRKKRFTAKVPNFVYHIDNTGEIGTKPLIEVSDSGHESNLPANSLWHAGRNQNVMIIINPGVSEKFNLLGIQKMKKDLKEKYPRIIFDVDKALGEPITYWPSQYPDVPNIIHISLHADPDFSTSYNPRTATETATRNFTYTREQARNLMGLATHLVVKHKDTFKKGVTDATRKKEKEASFFSWLGSRITGLFVK